MKDNENLVIEPVTENVEQPTEQSTRMFTQEEVNDIVGKAKARTAAKFERKYEQERQEQDDLMNVLRAGTGLNSAKEIADTFRGHYASKGVEIPQKAQYSERDIQRLGRADADDFIRNGYEDVVEEVDRLTEIGIDKMDARQKETFKALVEHRQNADRERELSEIGIPREEYESEEFKNFSQKFDAKTPVKDIYGIYAKTKPKKQIEPMGSMKQTGQPDNGVKDFYSFEEASKFTKADFDKNPSLYKAVCDSMVKWK